MPLSDEYEHPRSFITKITHYKRVKIPRFISDTFVLLFFFLFFVFSIFRSSMFRIQWRSSMRCCRSPSIWARSVFTASTTFAILALFRTTRFSLSIKRCKAKFNFLFFENHKRSILLLAHSSGFQVGELHARRAGKDSRRRSQQQWAQLLEAQGALSAAESDQGRGRDSLHSHGQEAATGRQSTDSWRHTNSSCTTAWTTKTTRKIKNLKTNEPKTSNLEQMSDDFLDDIVNIEDQLSRKGLEEGIAHGTAQGERDGFAMGYEHGFAVGSELAYYASFVRILNETEKLKPGFYSAR